MLLWNGEDGQNQNRSVGQSKTAVCGRSPPILASGSHEKPVIPASSLRNTNKLYQVSMLLFRALPSRLFQRVWCVSMENQLKWLSMNSLCEKPRWTNQVKSVPNQV